MVCKRKELLGDVYNEEYSGVHVVAILTLANHNKDVASVDIQPQAALTTLGLVKTTMKHFRRNTMPHYGSQGHTLKCRMFSSQEHCKL